MKQALVNMLNMQHRMNTRVHEDWINQQFEWYRAIWIECGELMDHFGYKWWKKQEPDMEQVRLEAIDIWHFGLSALFTPGATVESIAADIETALADHQPQCVDVRTATESLAENSLATKGFSVACFWDLMNAAGLSFDDLYTAYVGKNVLNFFRQDNGYQEGTYQKTWAGREDNEHLVELVGTLNTDDEDFADALYVALTDRYRDVCEAG
ncbi:dUTP diphosphatase [Halioglobus pacificus]|uniref:dUTPase n=1 Tax=Parahalioglobus pacificus TaxID=930806 RepID=A0A918XFW0_9GAMM|nr:dUTP diphosphatase [Halioglobus pacificus]GHD29891.1 dUTPase [Halioglobus pacificus]